VIRQKFAIDGMAAAKSILDMVPETNLRFAEPPAKKDFFALIEGGEIHQTGFQIFYLAADLLKLFERRFETASGGIVSAAKLQDKVARSNHPASQSDALIDAPEFGFGLFIFPLELNQASEKPFYFGQQALSLKEGKETWHGMGKGEISESTS